MVVKLSTVFSGPLLETSVAGWLGHPSCWSMAAIPPLKHPTEAFRTNVFWRWLDRRASANATGTGAQVVGVKCIY